MNLLNIQIQDHLPKPSFLVQGMQDDVIGPDANAVVDWASKRLPHDHILTMDAGHFFHGQLAQLKTIISDAIDPYFSHTKDVL